MFCSVCGAPLQEGQLFCSRCGSNVGNQQQMMNQPTMNQHTMNQPTMNQQQLIPANDQPQNSVTPPGYPNYSYSNYPQMSPAPNKPIKEKKNKKILIFVIVFLIAAAGGITAYFLLRDKKGGSSNPKDATSNCVNSLQGDDIEQIIKLIPDDVLNLYISFNSEDFAMLDVSSADNWNNMLRQIYKENGNHIPDTLAPSYQFKVNDYTEGTLDEVLDELIKKQYLSETTTAFLKELLYTLDLENKFAIVNVTITENGEAHPTVDLCYRYEGSWYSFSALSIPDMLINYVKKSMCADDVSSGQTIGTALYTVLSNEDCYDELSKYFNGGILFTAEPGEEFKLVQGINAPKASKEFNNLLGNTAPKIKFTGYDQVGWAVSITADEKVTVWISTASNPTAFEVYPDASGVYK
ncbi:MAG: zinc ribbon domain-containing protein [Eubacterium sp.]|nr:zinc ribbon domain-containing protein [Eubacterium sp.]